MEDSPGMDTISFGSTPNVAFFASSGDSGRGISYPATSPHVVAVGGTVLTTDSQETGWSGSGGACSGHFPKPDYQTQKGIIVYPIDIDN